MNKILFMISVVIYSFLVWVTPNLVDFAKAADMKSQAKQDPRTLAIGILQPLSGPAGGWGIPIARGIELIADDINAKGGVKIGDDTYLLKCFREDNELSPEKAVTGTVKLIEKHKVDVIFGGCATHDTMPILPITTKAKIINLTPAFSNEILSKEANAPYCFETNMTPHEVFPGLWGYILKTYPKTKRVAEMCGNTMSGRYGADMDKKYVSTLGLNVVAEEYTESGAVKDFYPYLTRILKERPDIIHSTGLVPAEWALVIKQAREMGYKGLFMQEIEMAVDFLDIAGPENANGLITNAFVIDGPLSTMESRAFYNNYVKKYGEYDALAASTALTLPVYLKACQLAGTKDDTHKIVKIMETEKFQVFGQECWFDGGSKHYDVSHQFGYPQYVMEVKNGVNTVVGSIPVEQQFLDW